MEEGSSEAGFTDAGAENYDYTDYEGYYPDQYQYSYDATTMEGQAYSDQQTLTTGTTESWTNSPDVSQEHYLDHLTTEQTAGYFYDENGTLIDGYGGVESNDLSQEAYSQGYDISSPGTAETHSEDMKVKDSETVAKSVESSQYQSTIKTTGSVTSSSSRTRSRKERIEKRQALLEKNEDEKRKARETATKDNTLSAKKTGFNNRERAKFQMRLRIVQAIKRKRMPVQIRILPTPRKQLAPLEKYFESKSVDCVLSDIFWASIKGDIERVRLLVEVEGVSPIDSKLDPWNLHQTPLHWAAKGGSVPVITYLLAAGASPKCLDANGSLPLHLSCWASHVDASITLLQASNVKDLYVQDYDGALCPLDWIIVRGHTKLLQAIVKYEDSLWLPQFVEDLIGGIVRYKIKLFNNIPKTKASANVIISADSAIPSDKVLQPPVV